MPPNSPPVAEPGQRLAARVVDTLVVGLPVALIVRSDLVGLPRPTADVVTVPILASLLLVYEWLQLALWGRTLGKRFAGIEVVLAPPLTPTALPEPGNALEAPEDAPLGDDHPMDENGSDSGTPQPEEPGSGDAPGTTRPEGRPEGGSGPGMVENGSDQGMTRPEGRPEGGSGLEMVRSEEGENGSDRGTTRPEGLGGDFALETAQAGGGGGGSDVGMEPPSGGGRSDAGEMASGGGEGGSGGRGRALGPFRGGGDGLGPWRALLRVGVYAAPVAVRPVPVLGVVAGLFWVANAAFLFEGAQRQALHDRLAGTMVVRRSRPERPPVTGG
ncbi:RDD family protein [Thermomonospora umbrina]|uniref:RDD family protein n=1 Tax=Thermomonospora umbrina TaxID=111806 RepID=A0A3D9SPS5_9ACTN|nr:RDD family protein [Thermomonospora umbrina]REE97962.1 RDD family protein [Thermomonospora umbrina]